MERTLTAECTNKIGNEVLLKGFVTSRRDHGKIVFLNLSDRSSIIQVIVSVDLAKEVTIGSAISIIGTVKNRPEKLINPTMPTGNIEVEVKELQILSKSASYPFDMVKPELEMELSTLLKYRALTLRHPKVKSIFKVQETIIDTFRRAMQEKGFTEFQAPLLIPTAPEGGADVFEVKYFDRNVYLAQSPQLYKQILVGAFERVFSVNQIFRADPSATSRHLAEATSLDAEFGFIDSWIEVKDMAEYTIKYILSEVSNNCTAELELHGVTIPKADNKIPTLKLREAQAIIYQRTGRDCRTDKDLSPEDEREICKWSTEEHNSELVFISHYPTKSRPFYTYPDDEDPRYNQGFDLIIRGIECLTGGRRINDYSTLLTHAEQWGVDPGKMEIYLQAFKYGMPPEGGFAFGAERITMSILGLKNIPESTMFPRTQNELI